MVAQEDSAVLDLMRDAEHPDCWVCSPTNPSGLQVDFHPDEEDGVTATFDCHERFSGYSGFIHGGVVSSLLDGAMTNCLMARGEVSVTADLHVRFHEPLLIGKPARVSAHVKTSRHGLHVLEASLEQAGRLAASATGRFLAHPRTRFA